MPVAVLEASASSLPVVATKHAGITEAVVDGQTGYLVAEYDVRDMAEKMLTLAEEPELAARMGKAGRLRISAEYSIEASLSNLLRILEEAAVPSALG
jgi:glycosyltransferase involved in cell wall biosynthesis